ncbi:hypothetical protein MLD38_015946 [Melastoma candidum]|uniref:Uncharacterized protein n=1 Tax=Melastoma candidum TaxID=119954 RepID=A0ACB9RLG5_9MYRT|nr:hypothetical protein MLD38_015946 [Melastoma candidum]
MAATGTPGVGVGALRWWCIPAKGRVGKPGVAVVGVDVKEASWTGLKGSSCISSRKSLCCGAPRSALGVSGVEPQGQFLACFAEVAHRVKR